MDWKEYEKRIFEAIQMEYPNAAVSFNQKLLGLHSKTKRQCDLLVEEEIAGVQIRTVVEAKFHKRPIDIKGVEAFIGMLEDLNVHRGLMVAPAGYTKAAKQRAQKASTKLELDILDPQELQSFQGHCAIPYADDVGVLLRAPFGWVIDGSKQHPWPAVAYQQGINAQTAIDNVNFMYFQFWKKTNKADRELAALIEEQNNTLVNHYGQKNIFKIETNVGPTRNDGQTFIRTTNIGSKHCELSGFAEFSNFIFFCVMHCKENDIALNHRKIWNLIETALPIHISHSGKKG